MSVSQRTLTRVCGRAFAMAIFWLLPERAETYYLPPPGTNPYQNPLNNPFGNGGGLGGGGNQAVGITRATSKLPNPLNFWQYGQTTDVGVIHGTVRIYNEFGTIAQGGSLTQGGLNGGGGTSGQLPGQGSTQGDDPPQGVLLHVNYAAMYLPNQQQINQQAQNRNQNPYGGFGGYPGLGGGYPGYGGYPGAFGGIPGVPGKGVFGNGGNGI
jgi:hypothetical protein